MAKQKKPAPKAAPAENLSRRSFPHHSLEGALPLAQKIADEMGGRPMNRLLLADAVGIKPSSSNFRAMLSSANKYGLIKGNETAEEIALTEIGLKVTQRDDAAARTQALRQAALKAQPLGKFLEDYKNKKLPSPEMLPKILKAQYSIPADLAVACGEMITQNARFTGMLRDIGGSPHVLMQPGTLPMAPEEQAEEHDLDESEPDLEHVEPKIEPPAVLQRDAPTADAKAASTAALASKPIFVGHGKNTTPLQKLEALLSQFQIPFKATVREAHLGRPIPQKVKDTMLQCGSAILIFTKDEKFFDENGQELWRPSENVVHELGASSFAYGDRIVVFKEKGLHFPTNFQSIGYIEVEVESFEAKTMDLLKELIGFGLVKVMPM